MSKNNSNNEYKELDDFFSESLGNASVKPSQDVWLGIEKSLDEKKKKRYLLWLLPSLILLISGALGTYYFMPNDFFAGKTAEVNSLVNSTTAKTPASSSIENTVSANENKQTEEKNNTSTTSEKKSTIKKIQLAAVKNLNANLPNINNYEVKSEIGNDNLKRFFIEVPSEEINSTINDLKNSGYPDAFVMGAKQIQQLAKHEAKQTSPIAKTSSALGTTKNTFIAANISRVHKPVSEINSSSNSVTKTTSSEIPNKINSSDPNSEITPNTTSITPANGRTEIILEKNNSNTTTEPVTTNSVSSTNSIVTTTPTETTEAVVKTDSVKPETKNESTALIPPQKTNDSIKPSLKTDPKFAVYLLGGPVVTQTLPNPKFSGELSPVTYNAGLKFQFLPYKKLAVELGINYQTCSTQSKEAILTFSKSDHSDSQFHSSLGDMPVAYTNMMNGFSPIAPVDSFHVKYSYKINYSVINIPVGFKFYPVKKDKLAVSMFAAASNQFILNSISQLTIANENVTQSFTYNNVPGKKFNMSLLFGLGCEYKLFKNIYFAFEPGVRYYVTSPSMNAAIKSKRINFDGNVGFKIAF